MPYEVDYTDSINKGKIVVEDRTINEDTSIKLPGRNTTSYGEVIAENFLHLLENFASNTPPSNPVEGQLWYDTTNGVDQLKVYDGTVWVAAGGLKKSSTAPDVATSVIGDLWVDTDNGQLYLNSGSGWVLVGPTFSEGLATGPRVSTITGTDDKNYKVVVVDLDATPVMIVSYAAFTPKAVITGFPKINPGLNLNSTAFDSGILKYYGVAEKAEGLIVPGEAQAVPAANFLRGDAVSTTNFPIRIKNDSGVTIGSNAQTALESSAQSTVLKNTVSGSSIDLKVNQSNTPTTAIRVKSNVNDDPTVGINKLLPEEALDVVGNIQATGKLLVNSTEQSNDLDEGSIVAAGGAAIAKNLVVGENLTVGGTLAIGDIVANNTSNELGTEEIPWNRVYATKFVGNLEGSVSGTIEGRATSANKLTSATTFSMTGDVTSPSFTFDGQTGGLTKSFTTSISNTLISSKPLDRAPLSGDELLINKTSGTQTGLYKVTTETLLQGVPRTPAGAMMMYGGAVAPIGWLICDGRELTKAEYPLLWEAIGHNYRDPTELENSSATHFALPDFRGRFALGYMSDSTLSSTERVNEPSSRDLGTAGGQSQADILVSNLPNHEHDLKDSLKQEQFYAIADSEQTESSAGEVESLNISTSTTSNTSGIPTSGGLRNGGETGTNDWRTGQNGDELGAPISVTNPYQTVNYIIYTGE